MMSWPRKMGRRVAAAVTSRSTATTTDGGAVEPPIGTPLRQRGYMKKMWRRFAVKRKRYFILAGSTLAYYRRAPSGGVQKLLGKADVSSAHMESRGRRSISLHAWPHMWHLTARTADERDTWLQALEAARRQGRTAAMDASTVQLVVPDEARPERLDASAATADDAAALSAPVLRQRINSARTSAESAVGAMQRSLRDATEACDAGRPSAAATFVPARLQLEQFSKDAHELFDSVQTVVNEATEERESALAATKNALTQLEQMERQCAELQARVCQLERPPAAVDGAPIASSAASSAEWQDALEEFDADVELKSVRTTSVRRVAAQPSAPPASTAAPSTRRRPPQRKPRKRAPKRPPTRARRTTIPAKPKDTFVLWAFIKANFDRLHKLDLTRVALPVNLNEPLSFLQRSTEKLEYASLLSRAATRQDSSLQMVYVAAFVVSAWNNLSHRVLKPFNPLLWETYECERTDDLGWRCVAEQVSHHPPVLAMYADGSGWTYHDEIGVSSKYHGRAIQVTPTGGSLICFGNERGCEGRYSVRKGRVRTDVTGLFIGPLKMEQSGDFAVVNESSGEKCAMAFGERRAIEGTIEDAGGSTLWLLRGVWDAFVDAYRVLVERRPTRFNGAPSFETEPAMRVWSREAASVGSDSAYFLSALGVQLNEMEEGVAPTDSRHRADIRLLELADLDGASAAKQQLEQEQRARLAAASVDCEPVWFRRRANPDAAPVCYEFTDRYWQAKSAQNWSQCPRIF